MFQLLSLPYSLYAYSYRAVNKYLFVFIIILMCLVIAAMALSLAVDWYPRKDDYGLKNYYRPGLFKSWVFECILNLGNSWYLDELSNEKNFQFYFNTFASFLVLFNYIIPISLYVTMGSITKLSDVALFLFMYGLPTYINEIELTILL
jgi:magnesium-transporting ATPase (P-type)